MIPIEEIRERPEQFCFLLVKRTEMGDKRSICLQVLHLHLHFHLHFHLHLYVHSPAILFLLFSSPHKYGNCLTDFLDFVGVGHHLLLWTFLRDTLLLRLGRRCSVTKALLPSNFHCKLQRERLKVFVLEREKDTTVPLQNRSHSETICSPSKISSPFLLSSPVPSNSTDVASVLLLNNIHV